MGDAFTHSRERKRTPRRPLRVYATPSGSLVILSAQLADPQLLTDNKLEFVAAAYLYETIEDYDAEQRKRQP